MDKQELLRKYLDEEFSPVEEREALHTIADDEELRSALRFDLFLRQSFTGQNVSTETINVPEEFTNKVMMQIEQQESKKQLKSHAPGLNDKVLAWLDALFTPREFQLKPVVAVFMFLLILLLPLSLFYINETEDSEATQSGNNFETRTVSKTEELAWVRFVYVDDNAESIAIAGDFNSWEPDSLTKQQINGHNVWTGYFSLTRGIHKYMFVVDGEKWVTDPLAKMYKDDGFGNKNAIINL